jgi:hypothetical protein
VRAFEAFGGVPTGMIRYDNLKPTVILIAVGRERFAHPRFVAMRSHYGFDSFFCAPGIEGAHEKGGVDGEIGWFRRRPLTPIPLFPVMHGQVPRVTGWRASRYRQKRTVPAAAVRTDARQAGNYQCHGPPTFGRLLSSDPTGHPLRRRRWTDEHLARRYRDHGDLLSSWVKSSDSLRAATTPSTTVKTVLCHNDFIDGSLLVTATGDPVVTGVIDFDAHPSDDPMADLAQTLRNATFHQPSGAEELAAAYGSTQLTKSASRFMT